MVTLKQLLGGISLMLFVTWAGAVPVNVNKADALTIADSLKGIGDSKAQAIVEYREMHGPYRSVDTLLDVKGIGAKTLEKIRPDVLLSD